MGSHILLSNILEKLLRKQSYKGGLADKMSVTDIARKHDVSVDSIKAQLQIGTEVEMEHTDDRRKAREIAMDHLVEDPKYYSKLKQVEK